MTNKTPDSYFFHKKMFKDRNIILLRITFSNDATRFVQDPHGGNLKNIQNITF